MLVTHNQFDVAGSPVANMRDVPTEPFLKLDMLWIDFQPQASVWVGHGINGYAQKVTNEAEGVIELKLFKLNLITA